eukprot:TRINITY_DN9726_c0_g1_i2.p1 TRINITY_DN9726_c0_g1~~TRINITY_DN9726_c0_g1_i2.p1  ORF type:complete len:569 (-),score=176.26 TRINITY_DN9726_c0_g1_i2:87-1748(-)
MSDAAKGKSGARRRSSAATAAGPPPPALSSSSAQPPRKLSTSAAIVEAASTSSSSFSVKLAFQVAVAQALTVFFLYVGYQIMSMLDEVIEPMFWALFASILLKGPKDQILEYVTVNLGAQAGFAGRIAFLSKKFAMVFAPLLLVTIIHHFLIGDFPWIWIVIIFGTIFFLAFLYLSTVSPDWYDSFLTTSLLLFIMIGSLVFVVFFLFKAVMETSELAFDLKNLVERKINDPAVGEFLKSMNITTETIEEKTGFIRDQAEEWIAEQGYNVTQIRESIEYYQDAQVMEKIQNSLETLEFATVWNFVKSLDYASIYEKVMNVGGLASGILSNASEIFASIVNWILSGVNSFLDFIFFVGALFFFVGENSVLDSLFRLLPIPESNQKTVSTSLQASVNQIFICTFLLSIVHGLVTFGYYSVVGLPFPYSAGFLSGLATVIPFIPEWIAYIPSFAVLYFKGSAYLIHLFVGLLVVRWLAGNIDDMIYSQIPGSNPFITGLALAFGASTYGVQGLLIGPILVILCKTLFSIFTAYLHLDDSKDHPVVHGDDEKHEVKE